MSENDIVIQARDCGKCEHKDPAAGKMQCKLDPEFGCYASIRYAPNARVVCVRNEIKEVTLHESTDPHCPIGEIEACGIC